MTAVIKAPPRVRSFTGDSPPRPLRGIQSIEIGYGILTAIQEGPAPVALKTIAARSGLSPSAAHVYLASLVRTGLAQTVGRGLYALGPALVALGMTAIRQVDSFEAIRHQAHALRDETGLGAAIVTWSESGPIILYNIPGRYQALFDLRNGPISVLSTGAGNLFIGLLPRTQTRAMAIPEAAGEGVNARDCDTLLARIADKVSAAGYAVQAVKALPGFMAISAPIWNANGDVAYALTLTAPKALLDTSATGAHVKALLRATRAVSLGAAHSPKARTEHQRRTGGRAAGVR